MANPNSVDDFTTKLFGVVNGKATILQFPSLRRELLDTRKCYLLDNGLEVYVWIGKNSALEERKSAYEAAENLLRSFQRPESKIIRVIEGFERIRFRFEFETWMGFTDVVVPEDSEGKVSDVDAQGLLKAPLSKEEPKASTDCTANLQVWRLDGDRKSPLMGSDVSKFFSGDCYIFMYTYLGELGEEHLVGTWFGQQSLEEDQILATSEAGKMVESLKFLPVQVSMFEGNEPSQFFSIFQKLFVCKGGVSSGYQNFIASEELPDVTYSEDGLALFRVQKTGHENMLAIQVEAVATSLNSCYCYILHNGPSTFTWLGEATTSEDHERAMRLLDLLKPNIQPSAESEGSESNLFWDSIGGKLEYPSQIVGREVQTEASLFSCFLRKDSSDFKVKSEKLELDSLKTEEVFILDCQNEIYVWVGQDASSRMDMNISAVAKRYLEYKSLSSKDPRIQGPLSEDLSSIFMIYEGSEPSSFCRRFTSSSVMQTIQLLISGVAALETYVKKQEEFQEVLDFAVDRNLLKHFLEDQDVKNLEDIRKHMLTLLKRTKFNLKQFVSISDYDDHGYVNLALEALEFMKLKRKKDNSKR